MFFMNAADADALLDDTVRLCQARRLDAQGDRYYGPSAEFLEAEEPIYKERSRNIRLAVDHTDQWTRTDNERKKLRRMHCQLYHVQACYLAAMVALDTSLKVIAEAVSEPLQKFVDHTHLLMRKAYDEDIDKLMAQGTLRQDPRNEGALWASPDRSWYSALRGRPDEATSGRSGQADRRRV